MSYAIICNRGCEKNKLDNAYKHNKRLKKNYMNKNIDFERSKYNYSLKESKGSFEVEAKNIIKENNVQVNEKLIKYIAGEYVITSDKDYFKRVGKEETERYFKEAYNFVVNYRNLGEKYIISADVHMDEETPHMHLVYLPVLHTKDKDNNDIDALCFSKFWNGFEGYKDLQDSYYNFIKDKNFDLERGEGGNIHIPIETLKRITGFEKMKKLEKENENLKQKNNDLERFYKDILYVTINEYNISKEELKQKVKEKSKKKFKLNNIKENDSNINNKKDVNKKFKDSFDSNEVKVI